MKRLLLFARHYPPEISGGSRRPYLLAQELRNQGVDVRVCAPSLPPDEPGWAVPHPNRDPSTSSARSAFSLRALARDLLLWPDPDIRWCLRAAAHASEAARAENWTPDWVLSTSPPESIHVAGQKLAADLGARWAADFRDLWLKNPHRRERRRLHRRIGERRLARRLLPQAHLVTAVDETIAAELRDLGATNVHVLPHFTPTLTPQPVLLMDERLNIVHAGSISLSDPEALIDDLLVPFHQARAKNEKLHLHLVGRLTDAEQMAVTASPFADDITRHGPLPYAQALSIMAGADALAFVASRKMHVPPSKIADYSIFNVPIVPCGNGPWRTDPRAPPQDPATIMAELRAGAGRNYDWRAPDVRETAKTLLSLLEAPT